MTLWLVRAGEGVGAEQDALDGNFVGIGWPELGDLSGIETVEELKGVMSSSIPDAKPSTISNFTGQVFSFVRRIQIGDLVALPLRGTPAIAFGRVTGDYSYVPTANRYVKHQRTVTWLRQDVPRDQLDQDLLYSLGAFMTVCRIQRNNAEERVIAILSGKEIQTFSPKPLVVESADNDELGRFVDLEVWGRDQIRHRIAEHYSGHHLSELIGWILEAEGYTCLVSPPGADGGVDVLAGSGANGFEAPTMAVQVKSGRQIVDGPTISQLVGTMSKFGASHGLMVSWSGYTRQALADAKRLFFQVRLWTSDEILEMALKHYENLPASFRTNVPITRVFTLVQDEVSS